MSMKDQMRSEWIDSLKGIAILFIVALHCGREGLPKNVIRLLSSGSGWVQLFLIFSIYLSLVSFERQVSRGGFSWKVTVKWLRSRFCRLIPLYYTAFALTCLLKGFWPGSPAEAPSLTWSNVLSHLTFTYGLFPSFANSIVGGEWYIGVLAVLYMLVPLVFRYVSSIQRAFCFSIAGILVSYVVNRIAFEYIVPMAMDRQVYAAYFSVFCFVKSLPAMGMGALVYYLIQRHAKMIEGQKAFGGACLVLFILLYRGLMREESYLLFFSFQALTAVAFVALVLSVSVFHRLARFDPVFSFVGRHSFGLYVFHSLIIVILDGCGCLSVVLAKGWLVRYGLCLALALVLTLVAEKLVDHPLQKWFNAIFRQ